MPPTCDVFAAGATKSLRLPFDSVTAVWNRLMHEFVIAGIDFR